MSIVSRLKSLVRQKGWVRDLDHGGIVSTSWPLNYWQTGQSANAGTNEVVYACVQAYARTIAQLPGKHMRRNSEGYEEEVTDSPLAKVMGKPNSYQTRSDLLLNATSSLLYDGNAYILAIRNQRFEIEELHLMPPHACNPIVSKGEIFYHVSPDKVSGIENAMIAPARDVGHIRLNTPHDPLIGETPVYAASTSVAINRLISGHQSKFFENMSRPSGILETDEKLKPEQVAELRKRWEEQSTGLNSGKVPILSWGIKWKPMSLNSVDAQLIEAQKMSVERIASVYGVPLPIIGVLDDATYSNVHNLINFWKANGLGFVLEHIEQNIAVLFGLPPGERFELDTKRLLRTDMVARIDALTKGITGGLYAPNEGRKEEGLPPVDGGDMPRVQQQMVPLDHEETEAAEEPFDSAKFIRAASRKICQRQH